MKKKLTAEQVAFRLYDALMYTCIRHGINPAEEQVIVNAFDEFDVLSGSKKSQWKFVYVHTSRLVREAANG